MRTLRVLFQVGPLVICALATGALADEGGEHHHHAVVEMERFGKVEFPVSCGASVQAKFDRGVALLHSFWYEESEKAFTELAASEPTCAMAYWGLAMSMFHPIWAAANPSGEPSPAELAKGREAVEKAKAAKPPTERERDYIDAVGAFFQDPGAGGYPARALAFEQAMERVHRRHPDDREAGIFYGLALLGNAPPSDKTYARQKKAAEILNKILPDAPEHPGIAHYIIHSFDYPELAALALPAANAYSKIAPSAPHALHMPSHIFTRLALWDQSIESNLASAQSGRRYVERTQPGAANYEELHALDYLAYAYLQGARDREARGILDKILAVERVDVERFSGSYALAAVPARFALERRQWSDAAALTVRPSSFPWQKFPYAEALTHFTRAVGGARGGNLEAAKEGLGRLDAIHEGLVKVNDTYWAGQVEIQRLAASAWIAHAEGRSEEALKLMRSAAELEDSTEKHPVTPGSILPAREMLGDLLLSQGDPKLALREYESSLATAPGRFNSLAGAIRAAERGGHHAKARDLYAKLHANCVKADGSRPELADLRAAYSAGSGTGK